MLQRVRIFVKNKMDADWLFEHLEGEDFLFSSSFYEKQTKIKGLKAGIKHYNNLGWKLGLDPSENFSTNEYLRKYEDVAKANVNPLLHYLRHGKNEGRFVTRLSADTQFEQEPAIEPGPAPVAAPPHEAPAVHAPPPEPEVIAPAPVPAPDLRDRKYLSLVKQKAIELGLYSNDYYYSFYEDIKRAGVDSFMHYVDQGWREGRNPSAHFDTAFYLKENPGARQNDICPLIHHIATNEARRPRPVPDNRVVFDPASHGPAAQQIENGPLKIGVHAHIFFPELTGEVVLALMQLPASAHVRFTTVHAGDKIFVENYVTAQTPRWTFDVRYSPKLGRDIGPLFNDCADLWRDKDYILHVHTKRSRHTTFGDAWRRYLLDQCLGSEALIGTILARFENDPGLACLYPENFYEIKPFVGANGNEGYLSALFNAIGLTFDVKFIKDFGAGAMVWMRTSHYAPLVDYLTSFQAFGGEEQIEATLAHVLERGLAGIPLAQGYRAESYTVPVRQTLDYKPYARGLPVYHDARTPRWHRDTARIALNRPSKLSPRFPFYNDKCLNIHWIIPSFGLGAGGHMTIFRFVEYFEKFGHQQTIWVQNAGNYNVPADALAAIRKHYRPLGDRVFLRFLPDDVRQLSGDVLIATDCWTVYPAAATINFKERFYFVQDYEVDFHPVGANSLVVSATYDMNFAALCAGPWLAGKAQQHGMWARQWHLAADKDIYFPAALNQSRVSRKHTLDIAFYARTNTPRRAVELGFIAFEELALRGSRFRIHAFGGSGDYFAAKGCECIDHGIMAPEALAQLYRDCDIGVVFSATNYSLIPLEMMACGLPLVEIGSPSVRAVFGDDEIVMTEPNPLAIADGIEKLMMSEPLRMAYREAGLKAVHKFDWETSARQAEAAIKERLSELGNRTIDPAAVCAPHIHKCRTASVFIPVKNGGAFYEKVIDRILAQKTDFEFDFLCIDSGSDDGTVNMLRRKARANPKVRVSEIPPNQFQHGRTRNLGISMTDGEYVAITTADALPVDAFWLSELIGGFQNGPRVAGVTGRHFPHPEHGKFLERDFAGSFNRFNELGNVYSFEDPVTSQIYPGGIEWQMINQFYSDNNSAMSRAVWNEVPYPEIDWGEDMVWCWEVLKMGFQKAYQHKAAVYHSHLWPLRDHRAWYQIEGLFWKSYFGIEITGAGFEQELAGWNERDRMFAIKSRVPFDALQYQLKLNDACIRGRMDGIKAGAV